MSSENIDVYAACREYFGGDDLAANVIMNKYMMKDDCGKFIERTPAEMMARIASEFERIERKYPNPMPRKDIDEAIDRFRYVVPQGSPLFGIGNGHQLTSIANCFVIDSPLDSYGGIFKQDQELAQIMKRRGGVGIDLSTIRPSGAVVDNAARTSDGVTCFMERFSNTTKEVAQNGRRGALLLSIDCRHPNILEFIDSKRNLTKVTGANISVKWTDEFLRAVENNEKFTLRFPVHLPPEKATMTKVVGARDVWNRFIEAAHASAEPGCLFWDTIKTQTIADCYADVGFDSISTNPCGELILSPYSECLLMSLNLASFVKNEFLDNAEFNYRLFETNVRRMVRLIDDAVDIEMEKIAEIIHKVKSDPEPAQVKSVELELWKNVLDTCRKGRRVGIGITGLADMLAKLNLRYGSDKALSKVEKVFRRLHETVYDESCNLAQERGRFEVWDWEKEKDSHYIRILPKELQEKIRKHGRRNISCTTCPPTGSVSLLTRTSSGIEPVFMLSYRRNKKMTQDEIDLGLKEDYVDSDGIKWVSFDVDHPGLVQWRSVHPGKPVEQSPYWKCTANDLDWKDRIRLQGTIQKYIDNSISVTTNLPASTTIEDVGAIYMMAWKERCKGLTIYREGSRKGVLEKKDAVVQRQAEKRPKVLPCNIHYSTIDGNEWVFFIGINGNRPYEIFGGKKEKVEIPKKHKSGWLVREGVKDEHGNHIYSLYIGSLDKSDERMIVNDVANIFSTRAGSYTRVISMMLRHNIPISVICEQLRKDRHAVIGSFESGISRVLKRYIADGERSGETCDKCRSVGSLQYRDGCVICVQCGGSKC